MFFSVYHQPPVFCTSLSIFVVGEYLFRKISVYVKVQRMRHKDLKRLVLIVFFLNPTLFVVNPLSCLQKVAE